MGERYSNSSVSATWHGQHVAWSALLFPPSEYCCGKIVDRWGGCYPAQSQRFNARFPKGSPTGLRLLGSGSFRQVALGGRCAIMPSSQRMSHSTQLPSGIGSAHRQSRRGHKLQSNFSLRLARFVIAAGEPACNTALLGPLARLARTNARIPGLLLQCLIPRARAGGARYNLSHCRYRSGCLAAGRRGRILLAPSTTCNRDVTVHIRSSCLASTCHSTTRRRTQAAHGVGFCELSFGTRRS